MTDFEIIALLAIAVLLWRIYVLTKLLRRVAVLMNQYAEALVLIGRGKGRVQKRDDGTYYFEGNTND
jgi:hypothetical protein